MFGIDALDNIGNALKLKRVWPNFWILYLKKCIQTKQHFCLKENNFVELNVVCLMYRNMVY